MSTDIAQLLSRCGVFLSLAALLLAFAVGQDGGSHHKYVPRKHEGKVEKRSKSGTEVHPRDHSPVTRSEGPRPKEKPPTREKSVEKREVQPGKELRQDHNVLKGKDATFKQESVKKEVKKENQGKEKASKDALKRKESAPVPNHTPSPARPKEGSASTFTKKDATKALSSKHFWDFRKAFSDLIPKERKKTEAERRREAAFDRHFRLSLGAELNSKGIPKWTRHTLKPGQQIHLYAGIASSGTPNLGLAHFSAPLGVGPHELALPKKAAETSFRQYLRFEVLRPHEVIESKSRDHPSWGSGGGTQFIHKKSIEWLIANKYIKEVPVAWPATHSPVFLKEKGK